MIKNPFRTLLAIGFLIGGTAHAANCEDNISDWNVKRALVSLRNFKTFDIPRAEVNAIHGKEGLQKILTCLQPLVKAAYDRSQKDDGGAHDAWSHGLEFQMLVEGRMNAPDTWTPDGSSRY